MQTDGYYYEFVNPQEQGVLKPLAGRAICRKCHPRCKRCTGYGFHEQVCQECAGYKRGEQCEDECPTDHYADEEHRECFECNIECRGCKGAGAHNCFQCHHFKLFNGAPNMNSTTFNCTATCPKEYPYKVYNEYTDQPYCSAVLSKSGFSSAGPAGSPIHWAFAFGLSVFLCGIVALTWLYWRQQAKMKKETVNMTRVMTGCEDAEPLRPSNIGPNLTKLNVINENELSIGQLLGRGAFGEVYKGVWEPQKIKTRIPVAIKCVKYNNQNFAATKEFLNEALIMSTVDHEYLVRLLGVCMTDQLMLITLLMPLGSLLEHVRKHKNKISAQTLLTWGKQIAEGMAYLEEKRMVHRDLAARNVLVASPTTVKITDFGLAQLLRSDSNEYKAAGGKMPIKWLAIECIRHQKFTSKSDVWAFGVTIWEMITFGCRPYENIPARDVPDYLESGERLNQFDYFSIDLYIELISCWQIVPDCRPSFKALVERFTLFAEDPDRYLAIKMPKSHYASCKDRDSMSTLARQQLSQDQSVLDIGDFSHSNGISQSLAGPSNVQPIIQGLKMHNLSQKRGGDETDSNHVIVLGNVRLELPLDDDDYLMPTSQNEANGMCGYTDLIGGPACVDNPEYLIGSMGPKTVASSSSTTSSQLPLSSPPTQTIGIPISPLVNGEQTSDHEYYNDLQHELQPLKRNEIFLGGHSSEQI